MPFGAIYGALFLAGFGFWVIFPSNQAIWGQTPAIRLFLFVLCSALALGLLLRRPWARWGGVLFAAALAAVTLVAAPFVGTAGFVVLFGSLATGGLLLMPATGGIRPEAAGEPSSADRPSGVLGWAAGAAVVGLLVSLGWAGYRQESNLLAGAVESTPVARVAERVRWTDFGAGLERSRAEDKPMLVTFITDWCGYCRKMDRTTWKHPTVVERMDELVAVRIDAEESRERNGYTGSELAGRYGVSGYPTVLLLDRGGRVVARTGGYQEPRQFLGWLEDAFSSLGYTRAASVESSGS
jgi:thiol:disulfide interchange protein